MLKKNTMMYNRKRVNNKIFTLNFYKLLNNKYYTIVKQYIIWKQSLLKQ